MQPRIVITRRFPGTGLERIDAAADAWIWPHDRPIDREVLSERVSEADGLLCMLTDRIDRGLLDRAPNLVVVSNMAVGVDNVDVDACADRGVVVGHTPEVLTDATADLAWTLLMASSRRIPEGAEAVRAGAWGPWNPTWMLGGDVSGSVLGVIGMGRIGRALVRRASGFAMEVLYTSRSPAEVDATRVELDELLRRSDHVVLAVPLTDRTKGMIGRRELAIMKPSANLVNIARGPIVDTDALVAALTDGVIRCAALDVTDPEPIPADHPLVGLPNCLIVPHIGSATRRTRIAMADLAVENLLTALRGEPMPARYRV